MAQTSEEFQTIQSVLKYMPDRSNDFDLNTHLEHIISIVDQKLQAILNNVFVAKRRNYAANAVAIVNEGDYDGDIVYFYVGISDLCEQYTALFAAFLSLRMLKSNQGYDENEAQRLATQISKNGIKLTIAQSRWRDNGNYIQLEPGLIVGTVGFELDEMDRLDFGMKAFTERFILCHEISHHLLGHTGRADVGSSYLRNLPLECQLWRNVSEEHARELQADALAVLLLTGETNKSLKSSRDFDAINDAMLGSLLTVTVLSQAIGSMINSSFSHPAAETRYQQCLAILKYSQRQNPGVELYFDEDIRQFQRLLAGIRNLANSKAQDSE